MELNDLKEIWANSGNPSLPINEAGLHKLLNHPSKRPIAIMKRNLKLEVFFLILFYGFVIWLISFEEGTEYLYYDIVLILVAILFFIYARYKYKLLNNMECNGCEVKSNLNLQLLSLEKLINLYFQAGNILVVVAYLFTGIISYINTKDNTASFPHIMEILIFLGIGSTLFVFNYYVSRWYLFKLYRRHIQKLKNILYEMDESDPS